MDLKCLFLKHKHLLSLNPEKSVNALTPWIQSEEYYTRGAKCAILYSRQYYITILSIIRSYYPNTNSDYYPSYRYTTCISKSKLAYLYALHVH